MKSKISFYLLRISFVSTIGGFLFGYDTAIISGCNGFLEQQFDLTPAMLGWVVSSALLGTIIGCIASGAITDGLGRKKTLIIAAGCLTLSAVGSMLPPQFLGDLENPLWILANKDLSLKVLISVRLLGGVGVGITSVVAPIYISELSMPNSRGRMVSLYQLSITLGILFAFLIDWLVLGFAGDAAGVIAQEPSSFIDWLFVSELWRGMLGTEIPIALLFFLLLFFVPESPRWLVSKDRFEEANEIMQKVNGPEYAETSLNEIRSAVKEESKGIKELLNPVLRTPLLIGILLPMFSHLSGIAAIMYFAPNIINESVNSVENSFLGAVMVGIVNSAFTFVAIFKIDSLGRRKLLLAGVVGTFISLSSIGILFAVGSSYVIVPLLVYVACFAFSFGPVVWVVISEIFPTSIRGLAVSVGSFSLMTTGFLITLTNPMLIKEIMPSGTFFLYAALTLPAIWFIWRFVPETKGKTLEEIQHSWTKKQR